jgi:hypothetical protein
MNSMHEMRQTEPDAGGERIFSPLYPSAFVKNIAPKIMESLDDAKRNLKPIEKKMGVHAATKMGCVGMDCVEACLVAIAEGPCSRSGVPTTQTNARILMNFHSRIRRRPHLGPLLNESAHSQSDLFAVAKREKVVDFPSKFSSYTYGLHNYCEYSCYCRLQPEYVNIGGGANGISYGDNWIAKQRTGQYILGDLSDRRLVTYEQVFKGWEKELRFQVRRRDAEASL